MPPRTRFIQPDVLSQIASLELLARGVVEGFVAGLHRSPHKGVSVDFMEYRPYIPGDDLRHVDWKVYARTDRYYVKEYEDDTNTRVHLLVDTSRSMEYASGEGLSKRVYSFYLAAALAYLAAGQHDAPGLTLFDDDIRHQLPARAAGKHLHTLLKALEDAGPGGATDVGKPLHRLAQRQTERGIVVLISDLLDDPERIAEGLEHFRYRGHEVIVFHVMDPQEVQFDFGARAVKLKDLETEEELLMEPSATRAAYLDSLRQYRAALEKSCGALGIDYTLLTTDQPLDFALFAYLKARS